MSLIRLAVLLLASVILMLSVVVIRTETTRVQRRISETDREIALLRRLIREKELDLARLTSPELIRDQWLDIEVGEDPTAKPAPPPSPPRRGKPRRP